MSRYIDVKWLEENAKEYSLGYYEDDEWATPLNVLDTAPSIDLADYVPKDFHDKTCEAMAKAHQEEIADMVSVVRCRECKHYEPYSASCNISNGLRNANADGFCSYGERREP